MLVFRALILLIAVSWACAPPSTSAAADGSTCRTRFVRVPAALSIARGFDALTVTTDPAALALVEVEPDEGMVLGVESRASVFPRGHERPDRTKTTRAPGADFEKMREAWNTERDGIPVPDTEYVVEMTLVLFETDVPATPGWQPYSGRSKILWQRTLRQAEE